MSATLTAAAAPGSPAPGLSVAQWRSLARLCRWVERDHGSATSLIGAQVVTATRALHAARVARRRWRRDPQSPLRAAPLAGLAALAAAFEQLAARRRARPPAFFAQATNAIGHGLLLQMPAFKTWLQQAFPLEAASPPDATAEQAAARARQVLTSHCLALCAAQDSYQQRQRLLHLLSEHGYRQPLLQLVRRAAKDWAPDGWADSWETLTDIEDDARAIDAVGRACAAVTPALETCAQAPRVKKPKSTAAAPGVSGPAPEATRHRRQPPNPPGVAPAILRLAQLPRRTLWMAGAAAVLSVGVGLTLHLSRGSGPAAAPWVTFHDADGTTMSIDPESIQRDGRQVTYRVGVVRRREDSSAVAVFTTNCDTRQRRIETVQHYSGTRFETATRYEVRGTSTSAWPSSGADVRLLQAACDRP